MRMPPMDLADLSVPLAVLAVYLRTLSPGIVGGDSGELVAEACRLGTAHPPGYPTFTLLTYVVTKVLPDLPAPLDTPAGRANALSAAFGAFACYFIHASVRLCFPEDAASSFAGGVLAAGLYAFCPLVWQYSVSAEVFAFNNFFSALTVYLLLRFIKTRERSCGYLGAFVCGLAMTNQHTSILFQIPIAIFVLYSLITEPAPAPAATRNGNARTLGKSKSKVKRKKESVVSVAAESSASRPVPVAEACLKLGGAYLAGLMPYAYLPVAAYLNHVPGSWGDVLSLMGFFRHLARSDYGTFQLYSGEDSKTEGFVERCKLMAQDLSFTQGLHGVLPVLAAIGFMFLAWTGRRKRVMGFMLTAALATYVCVFHTLANLPLASPLLYGVHQRFWMQPMIIFCIFAGASVAGASALTFDSPVWRTLRRAGSFAVAVSVVLMQLRRNFAMSDQSGNYIFRDHSRNFLEHLEEDAIALINWDQLWTSVRYTQQCEDVRPDVTSINLSMMTYKWFETKKHLYPDVVFPGDFYASERARATDPKKKSGFTLLEFAKANLGGKRPIFIGGAMNYREEYFETAYAMVPYGYGKKVVPHPDQPPPVEFWEDTVRIFRDIARTQSPGSLPDLARWGEDTWESTVARMYWDAIVDVAAAALDSAISSIRSRTEAGVVGESDGDAALFRVVLEASYFFEVATTLDPEVDASAFKNLGLAHMEMVKSNIKTIFAEPPLRPETARIFGNVTVDAW
mmetsp:Transcript_22180/g.68136  ORF Transcript_22180/g.68136 Transcript_22180/m.68136 type:complete len:738 (+) Transcript_22180:98-2311(+)